MTLNSKFCRPWMYSFLALGQCVLCDIPSMWMSVCCLITHHNDFFSVICLHFGLVSSLLCSMCAEGGLLACQVSGCVCGRGLVDSKMHFIVVMLWEEAIGDISSHRIAWGNLYLVTLVYTCTYNRHAHLHTHVHYHIGKSTPWQLKWRLLSVLPFFLLPYAVTGHALFYSFLSIWH